MTQPRAHRYTSHLRWASRGPTSDYATYSRDYEIAIPGKALLRGSADPAFRGDASLHNPEELLLLALSSCHCLSYLALAARAEIAVTAYEDEAGGTMEEVGGAGRFVEVTLRPKVTLAEGADEARARALHEEAHTQCFIANSVNFPVRVVPVFVSP